VSSVQISSKTGRRGETRQLVERRKRKIKGGNNGQRRDEGFQGVVRGWT
jgi:hypothetical protein